ncbi:3-hydroxyacyl-CoA dehydrogenase family protein [Pseudonocardia acidicola]|uniref:3-hydroxyacyl-CoA dehydrogenase family protein n=1 Tax=Pseudonocardia acidicola TaxID=2724939 RepID=UPI0030844BA1
MPLIEIVHAPAIAPEQIDAARAAAELVGKETIVVRDAPGFATSRLGIALGLEAIRMLEEGVAAAEDIDRAMAPGYRHPMGPLRLTDLVGLDVRLDVARNLAQSYGERFTPPRLLVDKVAAGELGRKTGRGFYDWPE